MTQTQKEPGQTIKTTSNSRIFVANGKISPKKQANFLTKFQATILLVQITIDSDEHEVWLRELLDNLVELLLIMPNKAVLLRRIVILLAQSDRVSISQLEEQKKHFENIVSSYFKFLVDTKTERIVVLPVSIYSHNKGDINTHSIKELVRYIISGAYLEPILKNKRAI